MSTKDSGCLQWQVIHLMGQFIMERKHGVNLTVSDPAVHDIYRVMFNRLSCSTVSFIWQLPLEYVLQGLISIEILVMLPSTMKYISDDNTLCCPCVNKDRNTNTYDCHSTKETQHSESVSLPGGCGSQGTFHSNDSAKVGVNPPIVCLVPWWLCHLIMMCRIWTPEPANTSREGT